MNSEITNNEEKNEWPKLMEYKDGNFIVLMNSDYSGMVVYSKIGSNPVGTIATNHPNERWATSAFKPFTGKITLWN